MKKGIVVVAAVAASIALIGWIISWFRAPEAVATSAARPWPGGMGTLASIADGLPERKANDASVKLTALANALPKNEVCSEFVAREIARGELAIGEPPALPDVTAIRELLLREPLVWTRHEEIGHAETQTLRGVQLTVARALIASALARARANDRTAWNELHAVWKLARSLDGHHQMMEQTAVLTMVRMINAVAWKMPLPAPPWFSELQQRDSIRPLLEAYQHQTASYWKSGDELFPTKSLAASVEHDRLIAEEVFKSTQCDVNVRMNKLGTDVSSVWRRAFRYRAEREAVANALLARVRRPVAASSRCSDGAWAFDGTTLRFSRQIVTASPDRPMPLVLKIEP